LFTKDTKSRFVVANSAVAEDLGYTAADLIGKTVFDLHPPERAEKFFADEQALTACRSG
jgi:PAS domain S-box-containing protein